MVRSKAASSHASRRKSSLEGSEPELQHGGIFEIDIDLIHPAKVNDKIYRPVDPTDSSVQSLARSIRDNGQLEPIVLTDDNVILSGHRRRVGCHLAGVRMVKVRRFPIQSTDENFESVLVEFNEQRTKSADEIFREQLVKLDPVDAHRRLVDHRRQAAGVKVETMVITGVKKRAAISKAKAPFLSAIQKIVQENRQYWPLSDRRVHYAFLNDPPLRHASKPDSKYRNDDKSYDSLTEMLTRARLKGLIPWEAIHDPTRPVVTWDVFAGVTGFIQREVGRFLKRYFRDLQRTQPLHVEIVGEKNTIESIIRPVAWDYTVPYTIGRGYASLPPRREIVLRFQKSGKEQLLILFLSDFDPEGDDIALSFARSIRDDFGIQGVEAIKVALTSDQVREMNLPPLAKAKSGSSRRKGFVDRHQSDNVWELEAVPPDRLQQILRNAIESVFNMDLFRQEQAAEAQDAARLEAIRRSMRDYLQTLGDDSEDQEDSTMPEFDPDEEESDSDE